MRSLALAARFEAGSLYHLFSTKQDLLLAVLEMYRDGIGSMLLEPAWKGVADPIERIFALPGLGNYFINANLNRDEPLIIGIVAFTSISILVFNLLVDVAYAYLDPRIRY